MVRCKELLELSDSLSIISRPATMERAYAPWLDPKNLCICVSSCDGTLWQYYHMNQGPLS